MSIPRLFVVCLLLIGSAALIAGERKLEVAVGSTISTAKATAQHTITIKALEEGKTEYTITNGHHAHAVTLTKAQVADILSGTTVNLDLDENTKARITVKTTKKKRSGW